VGRNFSKDIPGDKGRVILNESAVKAFGWPVDESIIGKKIEYPGDTTYEVVGMVRDFNYWALQSPIQPMAIFHAEGRMYNFGGYEMALRIKPTDSENLRNLIAEVSKTWTQFAGDRPFQYEFVASMSLLTIRLMKHSVQKKNSVRACLCLPASPL